MGVAIIIILATVAGTVFAAYSGSGTTTSTVSGTSGQLINVNFGFAGTPDVTDTPGFMFWQNFASQVGLHLNVQYFESDATVAEALASGSIQVAEGAFTSTVDVNLALGNSSGSYPYEIFSNYEAVNDYAFVVQNSITSWSQLAGQPVATSGPGSESNLFCKLLLAEHGLSGSQINCATIGGGGSRYRALIAGQVVGDIAEPYQIVSAIATGSYHIMASIPQEFPSIMFSVLYTSTAYATQNPTVVTKITEAILLADRWAQNETAWVAKENEEFPGTNSTIAATAWKIWAEMGLWQANGGLTRANVVASENFLLQSSSISGYLNPKYFVTLTPLQQALSTLGNYTGGIIVNPNIPTINFTIPGFGSGSSTTSTTAFFPAIPVAGALLSTRKKSRKETSKSEAES